MPEFDHDRLEGLRNGAYGAPERTNVVVTVADLRWLTDQLTKYAPPKPEPVVDTPPAVEEIE